MSKIKTKINGVEQIYKFQGGGKKLYMEKDKNKNSEMQYYKLVVHEEFETLFENNVIELLSNIINYINTLECQQCHKEIQDVMTPNYFQLHTEDQKHFITFHFLCALKPTSIEKFQEIMNRFDYTSHIDDSKTL